MPATNLRELIAWLKAHPDQATAATAGIGTVAHIATIYFERMTGVHMTIVPYRSGAAADTDVIAGHVTFLFDQVTGGSAQLYRSGAVKAFAVAAKSRLAIAAGHSDSRRGWFAGPLCLDMVRILGTEGHAA